MQAWVQSADFSNRDFDADLDQALEALSSHDWAREAALGKRLESEGKESCPAGLGLVRADDEFLHICPQGSSATVHWHRRVRVLGLLWTRQQMDTWEDVPLSTIRQAIRHYYDGNDAELKRLL